MFPYGQQPPVCFSDFRTSTAVSVLCSLSVLWMVSLPLPDPALVVCCHLILHIYIYIHSYSGAHSCTVQCHPSLGSVFTPSSSHKFALSRALFAGFRSHCLWLFPGQVQAVPPHLVWPCPSAPSTTVNVTPSLPCISSLLYFLPMCWWNCCIPQSQFQSAWLLGVFQNCFSTCWLGEPWLFNFLSCLEILIMFTVWRAASSAFLFIFISRLFRWSTEQEYFLIFNAVIIICKTKLRQKIMIIIL